MDKQQFLRVFGSRIKFYRKRAGLTQVELAKRIGLSPGAGALSQVENGYRGLDSINIINIAKILKVHPSALFTDEELSNEDISLLSKFLLILEQKEKTEHWVAIKTLIQIDAEILM